MKYFFLFFIWSLTISCYADQNLHDWSGEYNYDVVLGKTVGGSNMYRNYTLFINQPSKKNPCVLEVEGYQTGLIKICSIQKEKNKINVLFKSYLNGSIVNRFGMEIPKVNEHLLSLIINNNNVILTQWYSTNCPGKNICNTTAIYFNKIE